MQNRNPNYEISSKCLFVQIPTCTGHIFYPILLSETYSSWPCVFSIKAIITPQIIDRTRLLEQYCQM